MVLPESPAGDESRASGVGVMMEKDEPSHARMTTFLACSMSMNRVSISEGWLKDKTYACVCSVCCYSSIINMM